MNIQKTVSIKEVAKIRDKLIALIEREKKKPINPKGEDWDEQEQYEIACDWFIEELQEAFDFDGEEE
jgi:NTP pyrophosphatase (non-canonical NTP hydrolase)